jgi:hypothetical protein
MTSEQAPDTSTTGMMGGGAFDAHSEYQRRVIESGDAALRAAIGSLALPPASETVAIADYGAGTGATSVHAMRTAIGVLREAEPGRPVLAIHNDVLRAATARDPEAGRYEAWVVRTVFEKRR